MRFMLLKNVVAIQRLRERFRFVVRRLGLCVTRLVLSHTLCDPFVILHILVYRRGTTRPGLAIAGHRQTENGILSVGT